MLYGWFMAGAELCRNYSPSRWDMPASSFTLCGSAGWLLCGWAGAQRSRLWAVEGISLLPELLLSDQQEIRALHFPWGGKSLHRFL